jgi:glycosyltransferase involved in cell wall biosynthesis
MKKKILFISNTSWSIYKFRYEYIKKLKKKFDCFIFSPDKQYKNSIKNIQFFSLKNNEIIFFKIYRILKKINFDYVIVYSFKMQLIITMINIIKKLNCIYIVAGRGSLLIKTGIFFYIGKAIINIILFSAKKIIFINPYDKSYFKNNFFFKKSTKLFTIPTEGISKKKINLKKKIKKSKKNFIFFSRIIKEKGILEYNDAIINLPKNILEKSNFYYAGPIKSISVGSSIIFQDKNLIKKLNKNKRLKYLGFIKNHKKILVKMDCLISPSYTEGAGKSVMEAAQLGLFVIASKVSGHSYILSKTGNILIKPTSANLIRAIIKFHNLEDNVVNKIKKNSVLKINNNFNTQMVTNKLQKIITLN